jgi:hypothetical protein
MIFLPVYLYKHRVFAIAILKKRRIMFKAIALTDYGVIYGKIKLKLNSIVKLAININ